MLIHLHGAQAYLCLDDSAWAGLRGWAMLHGWRPEGTYARETRRPLGEDYTSDLGQLISDTDAHNLAEAFKGSAISASLVQRSASPGISELQWPPESWRSLAADDPLHDDFIRWATVIDPQWLTQLGAFFSGGAVHIYASDDPGSSALHLVTIMAQRQELKLPMVAFGQTHA